MVTHQLAERISVEEANARELQKFNGKFGLFISLRILYVSLLLPSLYRLRSVFALLVYNLFLFCVVVASRVGSSHARL